ncbi:hypothetical protein MVEN_00708000 [Mycena venus]|uniref:Uncharacterized protein n=1 Tax=Mycena venus TaxID=2733690 RepID=A0A8H6YJP5_9AGAR|nr:hypothetical protein MVEN_00708000 [Mycena venus]
MSQYWAGGDAWTNPASQALPLRREGGNGGGFEYGSGAFDAMSQSWPYLTGSDTLDGFFGSAQLPASVDLSHVQANALTSVQTIPPTESLTVFHQASNSAPVGSINDELQDIFNQLGPNELAGNGTVGDISNADQFDFDSISAVPSRPPSSASDYSMFEMHPEELRRSISDNGSPITHDELARVVAVMSISAFGTQPSIALDVVLDDELKKP